MKVSTEIENGSPPELSISLLQSQLHGGVQLLLLLLLCCKISVYYQFVVNVMKFYNTEKVRSFGKILLYTN